MDGRYRGCARPGVLQLQGCGHSGRGSVGFSVFDKDENRDVFRTYGTFGRGAEYIMTAYVFLDMTPKGRNETGRGKLTEWVRPHDRYDVPGSADPFGQFVAQGDCCHTA
jgi:predicted dithiol-disulfide oxidoreductase (DUF899 family)